MTAATKQTGKKTAKKDARSEGNGGGGATQPQEIRVGKGAKASHLRALPVESIDVVEGFNPRQEIGPVDELAKSIKSNGLLNPITVRPHPDDPERYQLIAGERRLRACIQNGDEEVAANVRGGADVQDDAVALAMAVAENADGAGGRINLSPIEIGQAASRLMDEHEWTVNKAARHMGLNGRTLRRYVDLVRAPDDVRSRVESGGWSASAALQLAKVEDEGVRSQVMERISSLGEESPSAETVKKAAKEATRRQESMPNDDGGSVDSSTTTQPNKKGRGKSKAQVFAWLGKRDVQKEIARLAWHLEHEGGDYLNTDDPEIMQATAVVSALLWFRGELEASMPPTEADEEESNQAFERRQSFFRGLVADAASSHAGAPSDESEDDDGDDEGEIEVEVD